MAKFHPLKNSIVSFLKQIRDSFLPRWLRDSPLFRLFQNWLFQGAAKAEQTEILFRLSFEALVVAGLYLLFGARISYPVFSSVIVAHTLMWLFNGHFWALKISPERRMVRNTPVRIKRYLEKLANRVERAESITASVLSGSLSTGRFHEYSDIDIWFTKEKGFRRGLMAYLLGVRERSIAFLYRIPIELYFYDPDDYKGKNEDEKLLLLKDIGGCWKNMAPDSVPFSPKELNQIEFFSGKNSEK